MRTNFAVFVIFFGLATVDALRGGDWLRIGFWLVIGLLFLAADWLVEKRAARGPGGAPLPKA